MIVLKTKLQQGFPRVIPYNAIKGEYLIRIEESEYDKQGFCNCVELLISEGKPTLNRIKEIVIGWIDEQTDLRIISGFHYEGALVWLSRENQINYKAAFDLAMQFSGQHGTLPITFKFGTTEEPVYRKFETLEDLTAFYLATVGYIQGELAKGWAIKDSIDWTKYEETQV